MVDDKKQKELEKKLLEIQTRELKEKGIEPAPKREKPEIRPKKTGIIELEQKIEQIGKEINNLDELKDRISKTATTETLETIFAGALKTEASDIHFEPEEKGVRLRFRIDGLLQDMTGFDREAWVPVLNRIKLMAGLKLNVHDRPQDGRFTIRSQDTDIEVRISALPGAYGESIVMRMLDPRSIKKGLEELGLGEEVLEEVKKQLKKTTGAILTTGPTGSGKTTTLYAFLNYINEPGIKAITIEDPIEYHIKGVYQTQVEPEKGYSFSSGLRSIVRQDPDVILVGEIRDAETAEIAMHAALTGHLVFSTLHTNDAAGTIPRLIDMGIKPQIIAPAINMAMAQRLVRKLCPDCRKKDKPSPEEAEKIKSVLKKVAEKIEIWRARGCEKCGSSGYRGRIGIFEAFLIDSDIERLILKNPAVSEIRELVSKKGMRTMLEDGYLKVLAGLTDIAEVERVLG